jgi:3-oxoacyl-[acyl-carrier protein] reductase
MPEFTGKTALITGSGRGIGLGIARRLSELGCRVALNGRNVESLNLVVKSLPAAIAVAGDVSDPDEAKRVISNTLASFGQLDILVCNVGSGRSVAPGLESFSEWTRVFALNFWSTTNCVEAARSALARSKGSIVCISSICGLEVIPGAPVTYSAAKAALHAYVRGLARPLGQDGVRINAIAAGNVLFDDSIWNQRLLESPEAIASMLTKEVPLMRLGTPLDIADLVVFLASARTEFATGAIWRLDGGQSRS